MSINGGTEKNWCDFHINQLIFGPLVDKRLVKIARVCKNGPLWRFPHNSVKVYQPIPLKLYMSINGGTEKNWCDFHGDPHIFAPLVAKKLVKLAHVGGFRTTPSKVTDQFLSNFA